MPRTLFLLLGVVASVAIARWPTQVPWTTFTFLAVAAGLFLEPRLLVTVYVGHFIALVTLGVILGPTKPATIGAQIATLATTPSRRNKVTITQGRRTSHWPSKRSRRTGPAA